MPWEVERPPIFRKKNIMDSDVSLSADNAEMKRGLIGEKLLDLREISMIYPGTIALNKVNLNVRAGECHGIIGKNGAGKTTLMNVISGIIHPSEGRIFIHDSEIRSFSRKKSKKEGIFIITQEPQVIPDFTVAENLFYPDYIQKRDGRIDWRELFAKAGETVREAGLNLNVQANAGDLSISEQQLLLILKAFYLSDDQVVILDEVTAALTKNDQEFLFELIRKQTAAGKAILFISHRLSEIMKVCDRISVLRDGKKIATKRLDEVTETDLSSLIVGNDFVEESWENETQDSASREGELLLRANDLTVAGCIHNINLELRRGEVVGLAGLRGSGRTELLKTIVGAFRKDEGTIHTDGENVEFKNPGQALKRGIVYLPEDRDQEGLIQILSVKANLTLSSIRNHTGLFFIKEKEERQKAGELVDALDIRATSLEQEVQSLSGGNRQKVVIGKLILSSPRIYLLDEPTKGIDITSKMTILDIIRNRLTKNAAVVLTSPSLEELIQVSNRIIVLHEGKMVREFVQKDFDHEKIYLAMQNIND